MGRKGENFPELSKMEDTRFLRMLSIAPGLPDVRQASARGEPI